MSEPSIYERALHERLLALPKEQLVAMLVDAAKNWLAHDGLWFQAAERQCGMETAIALDVEAWAEFTVIEARRIMQRHGIASGGGLSALERALSYRLYAYLNVQATLHADSRSLTFVMKACRVQAARKRKGLPDFPCRPVGLVEYSNFARTIDPRIQTRCIACPPDAHPDEYWCAWQFTLPEP
ncbi:MAG TPA: DUF6125 family protein [Anaerolineae bacterium]|nr:DUF6125 family protein [Anaerolineae bacterium]HOQ99837.1 DUF6125 family protein [Anaerolineae bacterium]HPL30002.1 DUF6125 family protein [Anaerolineae bacterium]